MIIAEQMFFYACDCFDMMQEGHIKVEKNVDFYFVLIL